MKYMNIVVMMILTTIKLYGTSSFNHFMETTVPQQSHQNFTHFYNNFLQKLERNKKNKKLTLKTLRSNALTSLEVKDSAQYKNIQVQLRSKNTVRDARVYLTRYGAFEQFCQQEAQQARGVMNRVKGYFGDMKSKVVHAFTRAKHAIVG